MVYGLDVYKEFIQVCAVDAKGSKRKEYRIGATAEAIETWARQLGRRDQVVLEATFHTWAIHSILSRRRLLVKQRVAIKNAIRATLNRRLVSQPGGEPFSGKARRWMRSLELPETERFLLHNHLDLLEDLDRRIAAVDAQLLQAASLEHQARLLMTIPGVGVQVAVGLVATIGDVHRFASPNKLAAYLGLVPRVSQSAGRCHHGRITRAGSTIARSLVVEAAQILARMPTPLATTYWRVRRKRGHNVAVTALARKLVVVAWHLLHKDEPYRYAPVPSTHAKLRSLIPREQRERSRTPGTLDDVYLEMGLSLPSPASAGELRAAAVNRRVRTRLARRSLDA